MIADAFFGIVAWLYYLCFLSLAGLVSCITLTDSRPQDGRCTRERPDLRLTFLGLALSLLLWQSTLFLEVRIISPEAQLWLGRLNFTAIALAPYLALRFVQHVAGRGLGQPPWWMIGCRMETAILALLTLCTPLVSAAERVESGHAITTYGPLFPLYLLHVLGYWGAALLVAGRERRRASHRRGAKRRVRGQLTVVALGMLATGTIAFVTNALLPYVWNDFRWGDIGPLSTLLFLLSVAYAVFVHRLFGLRVVLRETVVYGLLLAFVLGVYSSTVFVVSQYLTEDADKLTQFGVLLIAFSFDPLRRFLEEKADRLLFGERTGHEEGKKRRGCGSGRFLSLLCPWRRH